MVIRALRLYRNAYQGLAPSVWLLSGVMLINRCGTMVLPYLTLYVTQHLHYSTTQAGVVMACFGVGALAGTYLGGRLTDRFGFYYVQVSSLFISGLFLLGLQFIEPFYGLCAGVFGFTLLGDTFRPANQAAIAHYSDATTRTRAYSLNRLAINLGWAVGGGLGGYLADINYALLFWVDGLTCLVAAGVLWLALPAPNAGQPTTTPPAQRSDAHGVAFASAHRDGLYLVFLALTLLFAIAFFQLFSLMPLYFKQVMRLDESAIGLLLSLNGLLVALLEMALVYGLEHRVQHKTTLIGLGVALTGLCYVTLTLGGWPGYALLAIVLTTFGEMFAMPYMQSFAVERSRPETRGQYLGLYSMVYALALIAAPALGTQLSERFGFTTLWLAMAGLSAVSAVGFWRLGHRLTTPAT